MLVIHLFIQEDEYINALQNSKGRKEYAVKVRLPPVFYPQSPIPLPKGNHCYQLSTLLEILYVHTNPCVAILTLGLAFTLSYVLFYIILKSISWILHLEFFKCNNISWQLFHVSTYRSVLSFPMAVWYSLIQLYQVFFISLAITKKTAMKIMLHTLLHACISAHMFSLLSGLFYFLLISSFCDYAILYAGVYFFLKFVLLRIHWAYWVEDSPFISYWKLLALYLFIYSPWLIFSSFLLLELQFTVGYTFSNCCACLLPTLLWWCMGLCSVVLFSRLR